MWFQSSGVDAIVLPTLTAAANAPGLEATSFLRQRMSAGRLVQPLKKALHATMRSRYDRGAVTGLDMVAEKRVSGRRVSLSQIGTESTVDLLSRARAGESAALELLFERCLPALCRWARGRLPGYARGSAETQDLVQEAVLHTVRNLGGFEARHQGALQAYLRQAVVNRIRDEVRRVMRHPAPVPVTETLPDAAPSPLQQAIGAEGIQRYETALGRLRASDREAIVARIELQQSYEEIAVALRKPTANAARAAVTRALARLIEELGHDR